MPHHVVNPPGLHDPTGFGHSHVVRAPATELVFVAGQYGAGPDAELVSADFAEQVKRSFLNLGIALDAGGVGFKDVVQIRTYVVEHDLSKLSIILDALHETWPDGLPAQTLTGVAGLAIPGMLFEVDAIAVKP